MPNMKHMKKRRRIIILVPYPAQGHVSPMQKLASAFLGEGLEPVIVLPQYIHRQIFFHHHNHNHYGRNSDDNDDGIQWVGLPDGLDQEEDTNTPAADFFGIERAMENIMPAHLEQFLIHKKKQLIAAEDDAHIVCLVADLLASWALPVAHMCALPTAGFWPAMLATYRLIAAIPHMLRSGLISDAGLPEHEGRICLVPDLPLISTEDLPWLIGTITAKKARFQFWIRTLERSRTLKWLLVNSFPDESRVLELPTTTPQLAKISSSQGCLRVLPIGPICDCGQNQLLTKNLSFWEEDLSCLKWLATQKTNSVVYISFGSWVSPIGEAELKSLALALEASHRPFIWALRPTWREGLPIGFLERVSKQEGRGRIVSWAPQTEILQHESVGCYITHCGWNSILEALQFQKRLLCYPVAGDQILNCAYIVQVWKVGLKLNGLGQKEIEEGLISVMEDKEMDTRLVKLYERIMGMQGNDNNAIARGAFMLKAFVEDLKKSASTTV